MKSNFFKKCFKQTGRAFLIALVSLAFPWDASAAVPKLVTYNGILKNTGGSFLTGTYSMKFRIYSASTGGTVLWTETQSSVSVSSGRFSVQLGGVTALNLDFGQDYWLSVEIGTDGEMTPRQRLTSVGYAYMAEQVVNGFTQAQHDALTHKNIEGVRDNTVNIAKTNFKLDAYSVASANSMGDMIVDTFNDATGIASGSSSSYNWRGTPNYDVVAASGGIDANAFLVLHGNGTSGSTTFTDSSQYNRTATAQGNAQLSTAQLKFGSASLVLDGAGDGLKYTSFPALGTGNFTIDFWLRFNTHSDEKTLFKTPGTNELQFNWHTVSGGRWDLAVGGTTLSVNVASVTGSWMHIAMVRNGSTVAVYKDGVSQGSFTASGNVSQNDLWLGLHNTGIFSVDGWIDEFRVSDVARWTANFTPPSAEYSSSAGSATVVSNAFSEPVAPTEAIVIADETLNTGTITYYVSRDNGTTWTQCPKETVANISSQPSGTQLRWKAVITNDAELNSIAVAV